MTKTKVTAEEALAFHMEPTPGKWEVQATVPMTTQRDLSLDLRPVGVVIKKDLASGWYRQVG